VSNYDDDIDDLDSEEDDQDGFFDRGEDVNDDDADDDNDSVQATDLALSGRGSPKAELERMLEEMDDDDPRRRSIEREFERVMEESIGRFGVGVFG